ncbi:hypothetical protein Q9B79_06460 [Bacillus sp. MHSD_36]|uniref:hypothetical protein n=1 Tax=Bacillus TaxID=1386 RepID=UPI00142ED513|nr:MULTISPECIES: hypothetical protein [Bacillus]MDP7989427.1 hypothetical protein [Bacillus sp. MHSD_36]MDR4977299.1 hypothetical protein [Bacillus sp. MHSD_37]
MCTYWETQLKTSLRGKNWNEIKEQLAKANCSIQGDTEKTTLHECWHTAYIQY